jgi:hypothetical protein
LKRALDGAVPASGTSTVTLGGERTVAWSRSPFSLRFADGRIEVKAELPCPAQSRAPISLRAGAD